MYDRCLVNTKAEAEKPEKLGNVAVMNTLPGFMLYFVVKVMQTSKIFTSSAVASRYSESASFPGQCSLSVYLTSCHIFLTR